MLISFCVQREGGGNNFKNLDSLLGLKPVFVPRKFLGRFTPLGGGMRLQIFRPHRLRAVHGFGLLIQMSHVVWSVCLCVGHTGELCKMG